MRKIKEVLRLKYEHSLTNRIIARSCSIVRATVTEYLRRAEEAGLGWPLPPDLDDAELDRRPFPPPPSDVAGSRTFPNWAEVHRELRGKGVTLFLLWEEYKQNDPHGYQYSWFCEQYRKWAQKVDVVMRQAHRAGEKLFVYYAGQTVPVIDPGTGEIKNPKSFLASSGPAITPTQRPPGPRRFPTGSVPMCGL
jgi:transposase